MSDESEHGCGTEYGADSTACQEQIPRLTMHVDGNRDGIADDDITALDSWTWGPNQKGAIVLVNNDDDNSNHRVDNSNAVVDGSDDEADLAPLLLKRNPPGLPFPAGYTARLSVSDPQKIRIFKRGSWSEFIGPGTPSGRNTITDLSPQCIEFGMEAIQYPGQAPDRDFEGLITLTLEVLEPGGAVRSTQRAQVRVAPWLMPNHLNETEVIYVIQTRDNGSVRTQLADQVRGTGVPPPVEFTDNDDRWIQDAMEIGFSSLPKPQGYAHMPNPRGDATWHLPVVIPTASNREGNRLDLVPERRLLGPNYGYCRPQAAISGSSLDSFGNLECCPPVTANGREYKFGRIIYGHDARRPMHRNMRRFLEKQKVQAPFHIDTSWLAVGHVDEMYTICPWQGTEKHFKVVLASPRRALEILRLLRDIGREDAPLFSGISTRLGYRLNTVKKILDSDWFVRKNETAQGKIDDVKQQLQTELGLSEDDFVELPVLFSAYVSNEINCAAGTGEPVFVHNSASGEWEPFCRSGGTETPATVIGDTASCSAGSGRLMARILSDGSEDYFCSLGETLNPARRWYTHPRWQVAYTGNAVNMLVVTKADGTARMIIPKPYGPLIDASGSECEFEKEINAVFIGSGNEHEFIDCFTAYHHLEGEIHCGTNSKRKPPVNRWWWEQQGIT